MGHPKVHVGMELPSIARADGVITPLEASSSNCGQEECRSE